MEKNPQSRDAQQDEKVSMSHEDYLEAIVILGGTQDHPVRSVDIASQLNVSKASVNKAVNSLKERGLLDQPYYGDVTLTEKGYIYGQRILARHELLSYFLEEGLGIDHETAEYEACQMEHAISDDSFEKWCNFISKFKEAHLNSTASKPW